MVLIVGGGIGFYDRGRRQLGVAFVVAGCFVDTLGTFILGAPWERKNQPDCYKNQSAYGARFHGRNIVIQPKLEVLEALNLVEC